MDWVTAYIIPRYKRGVFGTNVLVLDLGNDLENENIFAILFLRDAILVLRDTT